MAYNIVPIDDNVICSALKWLILHAQKPDGSFKEVFEAEEDDSYSHLKTLMTALFVITMQEGREICAESVGITSEVSIRKAVSFLEGQLPKITDAPTVAFLSYAMASADKLNKDILMKHSTHGEDGLSWTVTGQSYSSMTALAVLALVKAKDFDKAREAVHWLKKQQDHKGGYGEPRVTTFVLWAMTEYHMLMKENQQNFSLDVELSIAGRRKPVKYTFKNYNRHFTWSDKVDRNKEFTVTARGTGTATLSVLTLYYARPAEKKSDCTFFDLTVKMEKDSETKQGAIETYTLDFYYKSDKPDKTDATMTVLDIGLPSGFNVDENDLKRLSTGKERYIQKYEIDKVLSERGSLILYLDKVLRKDPQIISFKMHKMFNVGLLQPAAVTIYEYYSPDARCTKFYHPERTDGALYKLCKGDLCQCAEENCSFQKKNVVSDDLRLNKACEAGMDYVYKVTVVGMDLQQTVDTYDMKVEEVLREGTDGEVKGKVRQFLAHPRCREHLGLVKGKSYLIMGKSVDLPKLGGSLQYIFGEQIWVEYWPTREESQTPEHRDRYMGISNLTDSLLKFGCAT